ncbi:MAG: phospholipase D-like domain-containing protein [Candidatus Auribacterota bacterium]|nr:phospholipase D-like domain-containing protein [Candidatus Auribacterota bacterium]
MKSSPISFEFIENNGPDNLRDTLKALLSQTSTSEVCIAVAFLTQSGLDEIIQPLCQVAAQGSVKLITGLYQHVTEPQALETLFNIQNETRGNFSVRLSTEPQFHRKFYIFESKSRMSAIVGSSNLTKEGLQSGGEINVIISSAKNMPSVKELKKIFEKEWKYRAIPLSAEQIKKYQKVRSKLAYFKSFSRSEIKKILGTAPTHQKATPSLPNETEFWRDCITGYVKKRTEQIISETTNWDAKNYFWHSAGGKHNYRIKDRIFLFDKAESRLRLVEVTDIARIKISTPDGRNFIAYKDVRGYGKRFSKTLWEALKKQGISSDDICKRVSLSKETAKKLSSLVKTKRAYR